METQDTTSELPLCPNCTEPMELIQTSPDRGGFAERSTFECGRCGVVFTEIVTGVSSIAERVSVLHHETYDAIQ